MHFFRDCKMWWTNPKRSRGLDTCLQSRWCLLKIPPQARFLLTFIGNRKDGEVRVHSLALPTQVLHYLLAHIDSHLHKSSRLQILYGQQATEKVRSCEKPTESCSGGIFCRQRVLREIKTAESHKRKENARSRLSWRVQFPLRDTPPIMPAACICTATSQQLAFLNLYLLWITCFLVSALEADKT